MLCWSGENGVFFLLRTFDSRSVDSPRPAHVAMAQLGYGPSGALIVGSRPHWLWPTVHLKVHWLGHSSYLVLVKVVFWTSILRYMCYNHRAPSV